jgi:hypothetical protein
VGRFGRLWDALFAIFLGVCVLITPVAWTAYQNGRPIQVNAEDIVSVHLYDPAAAPVRAFTRNAQPFSTPIGEIEGAIPLPLPHPVWQGFLCDGDLRLTLTLTGNRTITYGPCRYPEGIAGLFATVLNVQTSGACLPNCGPNGAPGP